MNKKLAKQLCLYIVIVMYGQFLAVLFLQMEFLKHYNLKEDFCYLKPENLP